jgi:hypothetical protein
LQTLWKKELLNTKKHIFFDHLSWNRLAWGLEGLSSPPLAASQSLDFSPQLNFLIRPAWLLFTNRGFSLHCVVQYHQLIHYIQTDPCLLDSPYIYEKSFEFCNQIKVFLLIKSVHVKLKWINLKFMGPLEWHLKYIKKIPNPYPCLTSCCNGYVHYWWFKVFHLIHKNRLTSN